MLFKSNISGYEVTYCNMTGIYQILDGEAVLKESKSFNAIEKYIETDGSSEKKGKKQRLEKKRYFADMANMKREQSPVWQRKIGMVQGLKYGS